MPIGNDRIILFLMYRYGQVYHIICTNYVILRLIRIFNNTTVIEIHQSIVYTLYTIQTKLTDCAV